MWPQLAEFGPWHLPVFGTVGPIPINSYGLMIAIAFITGLLLVLRDAKKRDIPVNVIADAAFYALPVGILGARLMHIIMFPHLYSWSDPVGWIAVWRGGLVFQGVIPAGLLFLWLYLRHYKVDFWQVCDIAFPYLPFAHAFGRVGCFLNGCCYGKVTDAPWATPFPRVPWDTSVRAEGSPAYLDHLRSGHIAPHDHWSLPIHPTQIYSFFGLMALCGIMLLLRRYWNPYTGFMMPLYFILYGIFRFIVEFYRGDHNPIHFGLTDQQIFSLLLIVAGIALYHYLKRRALRREAVA